MKTPVKAVIPQIRLYDRAPVPMQRQLYEGLRHIILHGRLGFGVRLPSTRRLAKALGVSRNAVLFAYEELAAEGLVIGRTGSGTRVESDTGFFFFDPDGHVLHCLGGWLLQRAQQPVMVGGKGFANPSSKEPRREQLKP